MALAMTAQARSTVAQAKSASSRTNGAPPEAKAASLKMTKTARKSRPFASPHRDLLMHLEEGQKGLQRQLESLTDTTQRRSDDLERGIDTLTGQLNRLASAQEQSTVTQQLLTATIRSMRLLLMIMVGLLVVLCAAVFFFVFQLKHFGGSQPEDRKQIDADIREAPERGLEARWR
jgi:hypothetical protein